MINDETETATPETPPTEAAAPAPKPTAATKKKVAKKKVTKKKAAKKAPVKAATPPAMQKVLDAWAKGVNVQSVPISLVTTEDGYNPRVAVGDISELEISMKANGFLMNFPIIVIRDGNKLVTRAGHRRLAAANKLGLKQVWVQLKSSEVEDLVLTVLENEGRPFSMYELATSYKRLREEKGMSLADTCKAVGKKQRYVQLRLQFLEKASEDLIAESRLSGDNRIISDSELLRMFLKHKDDPEAQTKAVVRKRQTVERLLELDKALKSGKIDRKTAQHEKQAAQPGMSKAKAVSFLKQGNSLYMNLMKSRLPLDEDNPEWEKMQKFFREIRKLEREGNLK